MKIRCQFANEGDDWFLWDTIPYGAWEAGKEFPKCEFESRELWVEIDDDSVQNALNLELKGKVT